MPCLNVKAKELIVSGLRQMSVPPSADPSGLLRQLSVDFRQVSSFLLPSVCNEPAARLPIYGNCLVAFAQQSVDLSQLSTVLIPSVCMRRAQRPGVGGLRSGASPGTCAIVAGPIFGPAAPPNPRAGMRPADDRPVLPPESFKERGDGARVPPPCSTSERGFGRFIPTVCSFTPTVGRLPPRISNRRKDTPGL